MSSSFNPGGTPPPVTGVDVGEFVVRFMHDKIVFIPKHSDTHTTFHLGPSTQQFDLHETRQSDGDHRTLITLPHANLAALVEEVREPFLVVLRGLFLPLRPGWMVRNCIRAVLGLIPQEANWVTVTKVRKKALTIDPEKLKRQIRVPEYFDELYALADGEAFTLFSCRPGRSPHAVGLGFKYTPMRSGVHASCGLNTGAPPRSCNTSANYSPPRAKNTAPSTLPPAKRDPPGTMSSGCDA